MADRYYYQGDRVEGRLEIKAGRLAGDRLGGRGLGINPALEVPAEVASPTVTLDGVKLVKDGELLAPAAASAR